MDSEFVTMREAQEILGVSNFTMWQLVKRGDLTAYQSATDRRKKLVRRSELDALRTPREIEPTGGGAKKVAA